MKFFNTVGPINPNDHYFLPHRLDWEQLNMFIERKYYFLLHAPRQSGKTTAIKEYVDYLNKEKNYTALYITTEPAHSVKDNPEKALYLLLFHINIALQKQHTSQKKILDYLKKLLKQGPDTIGSFYLFLQFWAKNNKKPVILFFDEIDGLIESSLIAFLKNLRTGYSERPEYFPQSICLIGVRDLRDYKIKTEKEIELGILYSPFNIKAESLKLSDFSLENVRNLYLQHTQETGQQFTEDAIEHAYYLTQGQPWLVNALAYQACFRDVLDRTIPITKEIIERAKEQLIIRRDTHIDGLLDRLNEPRIRNIIDAIVSGKTEIAVFNDDDLLYVRDLGLLKPKGIEIANPIYQEIIPRALTAFIQDMIIDQPSWYIVNNKLDMHKLFTNFTLFFREHSAIWQEKIFYLESMPHLLLMAFLQRVINGGGTIHREYAFGRKRVDIFIIWQQQRIVIELKIKHNSATLTDGIKQTAEYMDLGATEGHLIIFDRTPHKSWEEKISQATEIVNNKTVYVWQM